MTVHRSFGSVVVVVPFYRVELDENEIVSIRNCVEVLASFKKVLLHPRKLDGARLALTWGLDAYVAMPDECFASYERYNHTIRSQQFYELFADHEYLLLHELDAFVFSNALREWCEAGYDYVGAPLGPVAPEAVEYCKRGYWPRWTRFGWQPTSLRAESLYLLNGGFSLRKVAAFRTLTRRYAKQIELWGKNDDLFWSVAARAFRPRLRLPTEDVAARFALMTNVRHWLEKSGGRLPFGCHGWPRYETDVWSRLIPRPGTA